MGFFTIVKYPFELLYYLLKYPFERAFKKIILLKRKCMTRRYTSKLQNALNINARKRVELNEKIKVADKEILSIQLFIRGKIRNYVAYQHHLAKPKGINHELEFDAETIESWFNEDELVLVERGKSLILERNIINNQLMNIRNINTILTKSKTNTRLLDSNLDLSDHYIHIVTETHDIESDMDFTQQNLRDVQHVRALFDKWLNDISNANQQVENVNMEHRNAFKNIPNFSDHDVNKQFYDNVMSSQPLYTPTYTETINKDPQRTHIKTQVDLMSY